MTFTVWVGELMQLELCQDQQERFDQYLQKCFMKTASLMAHSCQAVSIISPNSCGRGLTYLVLTSCLIT